MAPLEERDLRSLERRSMYSIFKPLDEAERISRKLVAEDELMPTNAGNLFEVLGDNEWNVRDLVNASTGTLAASNSRIVFEEASSSSGRRQTTG